MKKFLVILMVVAMSSILFVGCLPGVTPVEPVEPVEPVVPTVKTDTPFITAITGGNTFNLLLTTTQYLRLLPTVTGVGVPGAIIRIYIDGVQAGVTSTGTLGTFPATGTALAGTVAEGVKKVYITAQASGFAESDKSTEYTFTYDKTKPKIASVVADSSANTITVTFNEAVQAGTASAALTIGNYQVDGLAITSLAIAKVSSTVVKITTPTLAVATGGTMFILSCKNILDTAGNAMATTFTESYVGVTVP